MKKVLFFLMVLPFMLLAREHTVPLGKQGNQLIYTVKNSKSVTLHNIEVVIKSAPEWMRFEKNFIFLESIPSKGREEVAFRFDVAEGEADQMGDVVIIVREINCQCALAGQTLTFRTIIDLDDSILLEPYPNPANPCATIPFAIKEEAQVKMTVYNILGQHVQTVLDEKRSAGRWSVFWDGKDEYSSLVSSGVYVIQLQIQSDGEERNWNKKLLLVK